MKKSRCQGEKVKFKHAYVHMYFICKFCAVFKPCTLFTYECEVYRWVEGGHFNT